MKALKKFAGENKAVVIAAVIAIVLAVAVMLKVKEEVTRFTLIMPLFAGFILFTILITADDDLEDKPPQKKDSSK